MKELLLIAIGSALVNNVVLSQFLGLCPFLGVSRKQRQQLIWALQSYSLLRSHLPAQALFMISFS